MFTYGCKFIIAQSQKFLTFSICKFPFNNKKRTQVILKKAKKKKTYGSTGGRLKGLRAAQVSINENFNEPNSIMLADLLTLLQGNT